MIVHVPWVEMTGWRDVALVARVTAHVHGLSLVHWEDVRVLQGRVGMNFHSLSGDCSSCSEMLCGKGQGLIRWVSHGLVLVLHHLQGRWVHLGWVGPCLPRCMLRVNIALWELTESMSCSSRVLSSKWRVLR